MAFRDTNSIYKKAIWLYLILLIFEGGLRRWVLPSFATPLLLVRDPIVVWLVIEGVRKGWIKSRHAILMMIVATTSLFVTLFVGHQDLVTAIYGWRIYFFYFPFIFVIGRVLTRNDILSMGRFLLYLSVPMTILIVLQFYAPQSAWINRGVGGDMEGAGFGGALGFYRPPGTFSFTAGYVSFQLVVACFLAYYLLKNNLLHKSLQIKSWLLWTILLAFLVSIPYSIARTHFFQSAVILVFTFIAVLIGRQSKRYILWGVVVLFISVFTISYFNILGDSLEAFTTRFESASESEGGLRGTLGNRYLGVIERALSNDFPFWGYGLGFGTNVGTKSLGLQDMYTKFNSDQEWVRVFGESGFVLGLMIMLIRVHFSLLLFYKSYKCLIARNDFLPWLICPAVLMMMMMGQLGPNANLGFAVFISGIGLSSLKMKRRKNNKYLLAKDKGGDSVIRN